MSAPVIGAAGDPGAGNVVIEASALCWRQSSSGHVQSYSETLWILADSAALPRDAASSFEQVSLLSDVGKQFHSNCSIFHYLALLIWSLISGHLPKLLKIKEALLDMRIGD